MLDTSFEMMGWLYSEHSEQSVNSFEHCNCIALDLIERGVSCMPKHHPLPPLTRRTRRRRRRRTPPPLHSRWRTWVSAEGERDGEEKGFGRERAAALRCRKSPVNLRGSDNVLLLTPLSLLPYPNFGCASINFTFPPGPCLNSETFSCMVDGLNDLCSCP